MVDSSDTDNTNRDTDLDRDREATKFVSESSRGLFHGELEVFASQCLGIMFLERRSMVVSFSFSSLASSLATNYSFMVLNSYLLILRKIVSLLCLSFGICVKRLLPWLLTGF
ncbi:uncharacterized protein LOC110226486 isoform X1 [Arabidopsis lyrata subsp. lyrata]|uniref:uncharacterized protein LOC110226486 isoform X1 n=1 Tax=Arabidopsis lyrata subsp. lyrata TaxID=81972 RepID=UPI000A29CD2C|nr:uncharacterized protein LOC110226486 isoform X1 [Arabidopsis lyrata subsp. lyrata]|eukprot:XP_020874046.1 uncharacterized protein LOC110226486 isoform X1 [Arabidopsis lyrata subsp. lyrata]